MGVDPQARWPHRVREILEGRMAEAPDLHWWTLAVAVPVPGVGEQLFAPTTPWRLDADATRERGVWLSDRAGVLVDLDIEVDGETAGPP